MQVEFDREEDARALAALVREMGGTPGNVHPREEKGNRATPLAQQRGPRVILRGMQQGRSYTIEDVRAWLEEAGYKASSASALLHRLVRAGLVHVLPGTPYAYQRAP